MYFRARAPLRLGLAGGGTDVSPYSDLYGGAILNATIDMYAYATVKPRNDNTIVIHARDRDERLELRSTEQLDLDGRLGLLKGVYNRVVRDFAREPLAFELTTHADAPAGSGLGTSSTMVVAALGAFSDWLKIPLGDYETAHLAFEIERKDLNLAGGKQDQYAATFGGFNFVEFYADDKVLVNPLRIRQEIVNELEFSLVLYHIGTSRLSSTIVEGQARNIEHQEERSIDAMNSLKRQAVMMKEAILKGELQGLGAIFDYGWQNKKQTAEGVTSDRIDEIYAAALKAGSTGGKISGAGGGGFMFFFCPGNSRYAVRSELEKFGGQFREFHFTSGGLTTWRAR